MLLAYARTVVLYLVLLFVVRLMGKRQIGQLEPSEFVVAMLVADLAAIPMQDSGIPLLCGVVPILTVLGAELLLSALSLRSIKLRRILCGKPVILIENGHILQQNLRRTRITLDELTGHLREKDVLDLRQVQYAILETNGNLSVFPFTKYMPAAAADAKIQVRDQYLPVTLVSDGVLIPENLQKAGKDRDWVTRILRGHNAALEDTWLLTVDAADTVFFLRKEAGA